MSGPVFSGDKIPENCNPKLKKWLEENKPLWKTSPFDYPGETEVEGLEDLIKIIQKESKKRKVSVREIVIGNSEIPPTDPSCLVYISVPYGGGCYDEYTRKNTKSDGRWIATKFGGLSMNILSNLNYEEETTLHRFIELMDETRREWKIDIQEVLLGISKIPPSDPQCLVYLNFSEDGKSYQIFFRKELKPWGRWINKSWMHHIKGLPGQEGTFDYNYNIAYI